MSKILSSAASIESRHCQNNETEPEPILIYVVRSKHIAITFSGLSVLVSKGNTSPPINITSELYHVIEST